MRCAVPGLARAVRAVPPLQHRPAPSRLIGLPVVRTLATAALDLLFPAVCPICSTRLGPGRRDPLCGACWASFVRLTPPLCAVCGLPVPSETALPCAVCRDASPAFDSLRAAASYGGAMREAIH